RAAGAFFQHMRLVGRERSPGFCRPWLAPAARPSNDGLFNFSGAANTEMQTELTLRKIRASTGNFLHLPAEGRLNLQSGSDGASIGLRSLQLESDPIPRIARFIVDQPQRPIYVIDQYVQLAISVIIAN